MKRFKNCRAFANVSSLGSHCTASYSYVCFSGVCGWAERTRQYGKPCADGRHTSNTRWSPRPQRRLEREWG